MEQRVRQHTRARGVHSFTRMKAFTIHIEQNSGYGLLARFDDALYPALAMDEPEPLGRDTAPDPVRVLAAAIGGCFTASLAFCLKKRGVETTQLRTSVHVEVGRNER